MFEDVYADSSMLGDVHVINAATTSHWTTSTRG